MINGIVNVYKESGFTSFDVVAKMRGIFHQKKIGHTGTLDPDAQGVLPVCLGRATKVCDLLTDKDKEYEAVMLLGMTTDTQDVSGTVLSRQEVTASEDAVKTVITSFEGEYMQIPPMYSALKVNGQKLCDLARKGIEVERKARPVTIHKIEILEIDLPRVRMKVECSKGTYIRTLCQDIGEKLGCGACMESLLRTRVSEFRLDGALRLQQIEELVQREDFSFVQSVDSVFMQYDSAQVMEIAKKMVENGNRIPKEMICNMCQEKEQKCIRLYDWENRFIGLYAYVPQEQDFKPIKLFI